MFGHGSFTSSRQEGHRQTRREIKPVFAPGALRGYLPQVQQLAQAEVDQWLAGGQVAGGRRCSRVQDEEFAAVSLAGLVLYTV
jgi:cytochrome P450